jgi:hypothetical protein
MAVNGGFAGDTRIFYRTGTDNLTKTAEKKAFILWISIWKC